MLRRFPSTSPRQRGRLRRVSPRLPQLPQAGSEQVAGPRLSGHAGGVHHGGALLCPLPVLPKHDKLQNFQDLVRREDVRCSSKNCSEFRVSDSRTLNRVRDPPSVGLCEAARVAQPVPWPCLAPAREGILMQRGPQLRAPRWRVGWHEGALGHSACVPCSCGHTQLGSSSPCSAVGPGRTRMCVPDFPPTSLASCLGPTTAPEFGVLTYCLPSDQALLQNSRFPQDRYSRLPCRWVSVHPVISPRAGPHSFEAWAPQHGGQLDEPARFFSGPAPLPSWSPSPAFNPGDTSAHKRRPSVTPRSVSPRPPAGGGCSLTNHCDEPGAGGLEKAGGGMGKRSLASQSLGFESQLCHPLGSYLGRFRSFPCPQFPQHLPHGAVRVRGGRAAVE